jgi:nucleotide-binding universal stress UspA family protein
MFRSILVPLDRSPLAEQALPPALAIARRAGAALDLVSAHTLYALAEPQYGRLPYDPVAEAEFRQQEQLYLDATAKRFVTFPRTPVTTAVIDGLVVDGLLGRVHDRRHDLIVMATHGRGPFGRALLGGVADEVVRRAPVPVVLVRPGVEAADRVPEPTIDCVLIALDGSPLAEQVLPPALELARLMEARCRLLRVVQAPASARPAAPPLAAERARAEAYLERIAGPVRRDGWPVETQVAFAPHAAEGIIEQAQALAPRCLLALATRGHGGLRRMLLGSVADEVIRGGPGPVLVLHPREARR